MYTSCTADAENSLISVDLKVFGDKFLGVKGEQNRHSFSEKGGIFVPVYGLFIIHV